MTLRAAWLPFVDDRRIASVRLRTYNPVEFLRRKGVDARVLRGGAPDVTEILVLQKAYAEEHRELARRHRAAGGAVVLDLCDNHFVRGEGSAALSERAEQLSEMLAHVDVVSVCTPQLGEVVPHPVVASVNDALDPVPTHRLVRRVGQKYRRTARVMWFGTAGAHGLPFGMRDLERVLPALGRAAGQTPFELVVVSNSRQAFRRLNPPKALRIRYLPWSRRAFGAAAAMSEVAVLPVEINEVTRGKTSNRVATAMQHGMSVVADPLPSYLAYEECVLFAEWEQHVPRYLKSAELRAAHVEQGRRITERLYSPAVIEREWRSVLRLALETRASANRTPRDGRTEA